MNEISVYKQMTYGTKECLDVIKREIGMKSTCAPFAVKLIEALKTLEPKTQQEELRAANTLLSGLQTLCQGGIIAEDYDKIDFVNRGGAIVPSARVEAFLRAAARKGYRITDTIVAIPKEDAATTYFKENFYNGEIIYTLEDLRKNTDREITAKRVIEKYFSKFLCRMDIHNIQKNERVAMTVCEMTVDELLTIASASEQGLFKSRWEEYNTKFGKKKRKVITDEMNYPDAFWIKWCGEMVKKTVIRRALKRVKEVLPELKETIYAFEQEELIEDNTPAEEPIVIEIPTKAETVDLMNLTELQQEECKETLDLWCKNPKLAKDKLAEIQEMIAKGIPPQEIINQEYAGIIVLKHSKEKWAKIGGYFDEASKAEAGNS